ncbi:MAG: hypothetical protein ACLU31_00005 [Ezakiella sp.]
MKNKGFKQIIFLLFAFLLILTGCKTNKDTKSKKAEEFANLFFEQVKVLQKTDNRIFTLEELNDTADDEAKKTVKKYYDDLREYISEEQLIKYLNDQELLSTKYYESDVTDYKIENFKAVPSDKKEGAVDATFDVTFINDSNAEIAKKSYKIRCMFDGDKMVDAFGEMSPPNEISQNK